MKRLCGILLAVLLLVGMAFCVNAEGTGELILSDDGTQFVYKGEVYRYAAIPYGDAIEPYGMQLIATQYQPDAEGYEWDVEFYQSPDAPGLIVVAGYHDTYYSVFANESGEAAVSAYLSGQYAYWWLWQIGADTACFAELTPELIATLDAPGAGTLTLDASDLQDVSSMDVVGVDASRSIRHTHGAIYAMDGGYYYLNFDALANEMFTGDGYFSYRGGEVTLTRLDDAAVTQLAAAEKNKQEWSSDYDYSDDYYDGRGNGLTLDWSWPTVDPTVTFIVIAVFLGLIVPLVPLILGLVFARSAKTKHPRSWYLLSALSAVWIVTAAGILLLITIGN